jgi:hypothetical protein
MHHVNITDTLRVALIGRDIYVQIIFRGKVWMESKFHDTAYNYSFNEKWLDEPILISHAERQFEQIINKLTILRS